MRRYDRWVVVVIWAVVLTGAVLLAALGADDDPNTDEASGAGALALVVGVLLTLLYFGVMAIVSPRAQSRPPGSTLRACPQCGNQMSRFARVCPHCRHESAPWKFHEGRWWTQTADGGWWFLDEDANEWKSGSVSSESAPSPQPEAR